MKTQNELKGCPFLEGIPSQDLRLICPIARIMAIRYRGMIYQLDDPEKLSIACSTVR